MLWDDEYFYVAAELEEPDVWATLTKHDSVIFRDNDFEVFLNPTGDTRNYFEFEINALNTGWDLFLPKPYRQGGKADNTWEIPGFERRCRWTARSTTPKDATADGASRSRSPGALSESGAAGTAGSRATEWRINFSRVEWQIRKTDGVRETAGVERGQLGLVAAGEDQHAHPGDVGATCDFEGLPLKP